MLTRRSLFALPVLLAAPAIVRASSLMAIKPVRPLYGSGAMGSAEMAALYAAANARMQAMLDELKSDWMVFGSASWINHQNGEIKRVSPQDVYL